MLFVMPLHSIGYSVNFEFSPAISKTLWGNTVEKNINFWNKDSKFNQSFSLGGLISCDVIFSERISLESGITFRNTNLNYSTINGDEFGNGNIYLKYSLLQIPVLFKYSIPLKKTTSVIDSLNIAGGLVLDYIAPNQSYRDETTTFVGFFLNPFVNCDIEMDVSYTHKIGTGKAIIGLRTDLSFIPSKYKISGREVKIGNLFSISPFIGYSFILKEDLIQAKKTEKNKRIRDISVE